MRAALFLTLAAGCGMLKGKVPDNVKSVAEDENVAKLEDGKSKLEQVEAAAPVSAQAKAAGVLPAKTSGSSFIPTAEYPPYPDAPHDPWLAVTGDQPFRLTEDELGRWRWRAEEFACTAAHDHCLPGNIWMLEQDADKERGGEARTGAPYGFGPEEPAVPGNLRSNNLRENFTAYRTVPATKKNLVPGALVFALSFPKKHPGSGADAVQTTWKIGVVDRVDWDMGFVYLKGQKKQLWTSSARVGVLSWRPGEKVQILGDAKKEALAVAPGDVVLPQ
jgi:hypothetical protein